MAKYLDSNGLAYLWGKMKSYVDAVIQSVGAITGVKGDAESVYRTGNVNLTAANIGAAASSHTHAASDVASGTLDIGRIPTGTGASQVALGNHTHNPADIGALPLSGGKLSGRVSFNDGTAMPNASTSTDFFVAGFQAFANGGGVWYKGLNDFKSWIGLSSYLALSGGTMTGSLNINTANLNIYDGTYYKKSTAAGFDRDGAAPSSDVWAGLAQLNDKDGNPFASLTSVARSSANGGWKDVGLYVYSHDGTNQIQNNLIMGIKPDGSKRVSLYPEPWRTALGILRYGRLAGQSSNITLTTSAQKIPFNSFGGSGCSASSNGIKVTGAGTYMIWASAYMTTGYTDNDIIHFIIYKNSTAMYEHQERTTNASPYKTVQIGPTFFDLAANDVVYLYAFNQASARGVIYSKSMTGLYLRQIA